MHHVFIQASEQQRSAKVNVRPYIPRSIRALAAILMQRRNAAEKMALKNFNALSSPRLCAFEERPMLESTSWP
jgi:hypothetical protein